MEWNPFAVAFGRALREMRQRKRIKQRGLANAAGISLTRCIQIENACFYKRQRRTLKRHSKEHAAVACCVANALGLVGFSRARFITAYDVVWKLDKALGRPEEAVRFISETLQQTPELSTMLWPAFLLGREKYVSYKRKLDATEDVELVQRVRDYIIGTKSEQCLGVSRHEEELLAA